jgi:hypothetical protein
MSKVFFLPLLPPEISIFFFIAYKNNICRKTKRKQKKPQFPPKKNFVGAAAADEIQQYTALTGGGRFCDEGIAANARNTHVHKTDSFFCFFQLKRKPDPPI